MYFASREGCKSNFSVTIVTLVVLHITLVCNAYNLTGIFLSNTAADNFKSGGSDQSCLNVSFHIIRRNTRADIRYHVFSELPLSTFEMDNQEFNN